MEILFGTLLIGIPVLLIGLFLFWNNYRPVFWMLAGAMIIGLGYLGMTGATRDLGQPIAEAVYGTSGTMSERAVDAAKKTMEIAKEKTAAAKEVIKKKAAEAKEAIKEKMEAAKRAADPAASPSSDTGSGSSPSGRYVTQ